MQCRHCGRCVGKCPFHTITNGIYGYKIYIGGRWGKKISRGKSLSKIFASKEEALNVIEKAILFFRDNGLKGERFAETIERIGLEARLLYFVGSEIPKVQYILSPLPV